MRATVAKTLTRYRNLIPIIMILIAAAYSAGCGAGGRVTDYASLIEDLRKTGATVEYTGEVTDSFFAVKGKVITMNGSNVQVFEYGDATTADNEASLISPDGFSVHRPGRDCGVDWIAPPHFYKAGKLIVLYVGESETVINALESVLGAQFAGQQQS